MMFLTLLVIFVLWLFIERLIKQRLDITTKRSWRFVNKGFTILFYTIGLAACILFAIMYPDFDFYLIFPFVGTLVALISSIEQFIYKKEERLYIVYLLDAVFWLIVGVTINTR
ncbi:DUF4181 domain-containing protein [Anaerobacillus sp. MEB173]|uniref:DUF4181 domain-containing protein n=1 Tax=Anaerobacillus sp. MEB173 TaxID=3383345 RepID=UPI003F8ED8C1